METILFALSALICVVAVSLAIEALLGARKVEELHRMPTDGGATPRVSIIFAALDEEEGVEAAALSHLAQEYPDFEVIAVDDRSSDRTPEILARLAAEHERLRTIRIDELPAGWLGKCHALHRASQAARGAWLLFTDADVVMEPSTLRHALALAERRSLDHLTVFPHFSLPGWMQAFATMFLMSLSMHLKPWRIPDPRSSAHAGVGAFNLVRRSVYRAAGGHESLRLEVLDDIGLGRLMKEAGGASRLVRGRKLIRVEWYPNFRAMVRGLTRGIFPGYGYSLRAAFAGTVATIAFFVWPVVGAWLGGWTAAFASVTGLVAASLYVVGAVDQRTPLWTVILLPAFGTLVTVLIWKSAVRTLSRGGVEWRGTFYPLDELREGGRGV